MRPTTTEDILSIIDAGTSSVAVGAAMELGLFWLLADRPLDVSGVSRALKIPEHRCRYWLQFLCRMGLLEKCPGKLHNQDLQEYRTSETARSAILDTYCRESWELLAGETRERSTAVRDLALHIREAGSVWESLKLPEPQNYFIPIAENPDYARRFTRMLYEIHLPVAEELGCYLDMTGVGRIMDLGGGSGVMSFDLLRRYPNLSATVVDVANVCHAGREIARENSLEDRMTYHPCDFLDEDLPFGFDMILECDVGHYNEALIGKIEGSLNPGGQFVIVDQFAPARDVAHPARVHWALWSSMEEEDYDFATADDVQDRMIHAGFQILSKEMLSPVETPRWSVGWTVIRGRKGVR